MKETQIKSKPGSGSSVTDPTRLRRSTEPVIDPLIIAIYGEPGCGKSRFLATGPDQIGIAPLERKTLQTATKIAAEFGKTVVWPEADLIRSVNALKIDSLDPFCQESSAKMQALSRDISIHDAAPRCCQIHYYRWHVNRTKAAIFALAEDPLVRVVCIDTFGQLCDDMLYANYGRLDNIMPLDRKSFNQEVKDFINAVNHKHLILTHHSSNVWKDNKPTARTQPQGFRKLGHYANVVLEFLKKDDAAEAEAVSYSVKVKDCQANPALIGQTILENDDITFANVAQMVYPDLDTDWS